MKKRSVVVVGIAVAVLSLAGAAGYIYLGPTGAQTAGATAKFESISPLEAKKLIETCPDLQLIDVRSPQEYQSGALPDSRLIPFWDFTKGRYDLAKDRPILLVCAVGGRSLAVGQLLASQGYREVYNLRGGLDSWVAQRVPLPSRTGR